MTPSLRHILFGGILPETRALVDAMTVKPNSTRVAHINRLIRAMKADGSWTRMDVFYMLAAHDEQAARLNWKNPGALTLTANNSPTFTVDRGFAGDGVSMNLTSTYRPSTFAGQFVLDDAMLGAYVHAANSTVSGMDVFLNASRVGTTATNTYGARVNDGVGILAAGAPAVGHWAGRRTASNVRETWKNGALVANDAAASTAVSSVDLVLLASTALGATPSNGRLSAAYAGGALTAQQMLSFHNSLLVLLRAVGAA